MPQGRRKDFSGKQKKLQMRQKRLRKEGEAADPRRETIRGHTAGRGDDDNEEEEEAAARPAEEVLQDRTQEMVESVPMPRSRGGRRKGGGGGGREKFELRFRRESKQELSRRREEARRPIPDLGKTVPTASSLREFFPDGMDFPKRPAWSRALDKQALEANEERHFKRFVEDVLARFDSVGHFELNLETWRQLWRVLEMSDILLVVVDARHPSAMFPPSLYDHARSTGKDVVLILNKVDLIPAPLALAWRHWFEESLPGLRVAFFSSCPNYNLRAAIGDREAGLRYRRLRGRISMVAEGALGVLEACRKAVGAAGADVDLDSWEELIREAVRRRRDEGKEDVGEAAAEIVRAEEGGDGQELQQEGGDGGEGGCPRFRQGVLTLGMVGQPNAGKSSLINSLVGRRVVSVSKTPGHTKHFQTIFITGSVRLCDSPGLVFPSVAPKPLQVLTGSYPISQVREPFSVVRHLAERVDLPRLLRIQHPSGQRRPGGDSGEDPCWSAFDICEGWARKRGYVTARSDRPDLNRAANHILRMTLEGRIGLRTEPATFAGEREDRWEAHPELKVLRELLQLRAPEAARHDEEELQEDSSEEEGGGDSEEEEEGGGGGPERPELSNKFDALLME